MPNLKIYGFPSEILKMLIPRLKELFKDDPEFNEIIITIIYSTAKTLKDEIPAPYIEVADSDTDRGRRLSNIISTRLHVDVEQTLIQEFTPASQ